MISIEMVIYSVFDGLIKYYFVVIKMVINSSVVIK